LTLGLLYVIRRASAMLPIIENGLDVVLCLKTFNFGHAIGHSQTIRRTTVSLQIIGNESDRL